MKTKILKWGNGLAVRIPAAIVKKASLREGDTIDLTIVEVGKRGIRSMSRTPTMAELIAQITPENRHDEISVGAALGAELLEWRGFRSEKF